MTGGCESRPPRITDAWCEITMRSRSSLSPPMRCSSPWAGRPPTQADAVMTTVAESARRLCRCQGVTIYLLHGEEFELATTVGLPPEFRSYVAAHPLRRDRETMAGRVALDRRIEQVSDVLTDPGYGRRDVQEIAGYRTLIAAPLILDDEVVGAISLWRTKVEPFDERATAMLSTFAAQAAAVVRNLHLVRELEGRQRELARKVEQLQALNEVGETVSSTLDLDEVLFKIILNAVRFAECDGGSIMEYVEAERRFLARTTYPSSPELLSGLRRINIVLDETLVGRAAREGRPIAISDIALVDRDVHLELLYEDGWRSVLAVPVLRDGQIIGVMVVRRKTLGTSPARSWSSWRRSPASPRSRCSTPASFVSSSARAASWKWPASTSRTSWRACLTS